MYEQSLQQQNDQLKEMKKCMEECYQLFQQKHARLNEMSLLQHENIALMEELTKCRDHVYQLLRQENDQLKEIQQLLVENVLLKERAIKLTELHAIDKTCLVLLLARRLIGGVYFVVMNFCIFLFGTCWWCELCGDECYEIPSYYVDFV
jgi:hypothetical protein